MALIKLFLGLEQRVEEIDSPSSNSEYAPGSFEEEDFEEEDKEEEQGEEASEDEVEAAVEEEEEEADLQVVVEPNQQPQQFTTPGAIRSVGMSSTPNRVSKKKTSIGGMADALPDELSRLDLRSGGEITLVENFPGFITKFGEQTSKIVAIDLLAFSGTGTNIEENPDLGYYEIKISKCGFFADVLFYYPLFILDPAWLTTGHPPYHSNCTRIQALQDAARSVKETFKLVRPHVTIKIKLPCAVRQNPRWCGCLSYPGNEDDENEASLIQMVSFEFVVLDDDVGMNKVVSSSVIKKPKPDKTPSGKPGMN